ncbi:TetR family transcriptional regulator C-terminal domain-containing protein [Nocardioides sp. CN2-186]|uniref:TetR/AcrR family transcriptional regulator n=1 Tax=Nocardioides tweenelious TaxID=3156607 RepID=UPI0032B3A913
MAEAAPATEGNEARRRAMLEAAAELISERGFGETRIADVAKRAGASSALVIYYFGTRDRLLVDALRYSEESFYDTAAKTLAEVTGFRERLSTIVEWCCVPQTDGEVSGAWGLWLDLWATAFRHEEVGEARVEQDRKWRDLVEGVLRDGQSSGEVAAELDVRRFALTFTMLLDGIATQVALEDPDINADLAYDIAIEYAEEKLGLDPMPRRSKPKKPAKKKRATKKA